MPRKKFALGEHPPMTEGAQAITTTIDYERADDLGHAWLNFELDLPLEQTPSGTNPFYVSRGDGPIDRLIDGLNSPFRVPPKYFLGGNKGSGKSNEMRRIAATASIKQRYMPFYFSIRDETDVNNLDFKDVMLAIGGRMYRDYKARGGKVPATLEADLDRWRGRVMEVIVSQPRLHDVEMEGGLAAFFAHLGLRIKLEPKTRQELRQVIDHDVSRLVNTINEICNVINRQSKRIPLLLIDDTDKADPDTSRAIFGERLETMLAPNCAIIYAVSDVLFYTPVFEGMRERAIFLPNVQLWDRAAKEFRVPGFEIMREFVLRRINPDLIERSALTHAIRISGGSFRELARVMRLAISRAQKSGHILPDHVLDAEVEIRGEFRRMLTAEQRDTLREAHRTGQLAQPARAPPLLQMNALMEYSDHEPWCAVHPALIEMLT